MNVTGNTALIEKLLKLAMGSSNKTTFWAFFRYVKVVTNVSKDWFLFGLYIRVVRLSREIYRGNLRVLLDNCKIRTPKNSVFGHILNSLVLLRGIIKPTTLLETTRRQMFSREYNNIFQNSCFAEHLRMTVSMLSFLFSFFLKFFTIQFFKTFSYQDSELCFVIFMSSKFF